MKASWECFVIVTTKIDEILWSQGESNFTLSPRRSLRIRPNEPDPIFKAMKPGNGKIRYESGRKSFSSYFRSLKVSRVDLNRDVSVQDPCNPIKYCNSQLKQYSIAPNSSLTSSVD